MAKKINQRKRVARRINRINMALLPEDIDSDFRLWAWGERATASAWSAELVKQAVRDNRDNIAAIVSRAAQRRGISVEEMAALILENPRLDWSESSD